MAQEIPPRIEGGQCHLIFVFRSLTEHGKSGRWERVSIPTRDRTQRIHLEIVRCAAENQALEIIAPCNQGENKRQVGTNLQLQTPDKHTREHAVEKSQRVHCIDLTAYISKNKNEEGYAARENEKHMSDPDVRKEDWMGGPHVHIKSIDKKETKDECPSLRFTSSGPGGVVAHDELAEKRLTARHWHEGVEVSIILPMFWKSTDVPQCTSNVGTDDARHTLRRRLFFRLEDSKWPECWTAWDIKSVLKKENYGNGGGVCPDL
ncbi:hypothetical protein B0H16DRAFT_1697782 [Mycena metata]|uniref:Uncharacterized protein n=1 Tax=Mycena metata TaxID=1033252 RepID=A0AAD7HSJ0_9AGAR|nr:hypothetical protein B0H16DRAFT_1697782 [Mycena metata]